MNQMLQVYITTRGIKSLGGSQGISKNRGIEGRKERKRVKGMEGQEKWSVQTERLLLKLVTKNPSFI